MERLTVGDIMVSEVITLSPTATVAQARQELDLSCIHHLPLVDGDYKLCGLVTPRDLIRSRGDAQRPLSELMRTDIKTARPDTPAHEAAYLLLRYPIGCVPVTSDDNTLLGLITETDYVRIAYRALGGRVPVDEIEREERDAELV